MSRRAQGDPQAWYGGAKWNQWSPQLPRTRKDKKNKEQDKERKAEGVLPSYDSMPLDSSTASSSSTGSDQQARAFMDAFIQYSKGQDLPDVLQAFLKKDNKDTKEDLRQQQRHLNLHRNVLQKIEAKKRAIKKDEDQWQNWVKEVKETIKTQKTKHEENMEKLQTELAELEKEEEEIRAGREADESAPIEIEEEDDAFEELFQTGKKDNSRKADQEKDKAEENARIQMMKEALEQEYQRKLEEACQSAQMCMQQQMQMHMMALAGQPPPGMDPIPAAMHPMEGGTSLPEPTKVGPFMRRSNVREAHSPYTRTQENKETMSERLKMTHGEAAEALAQQKGEG